MTGGIKTGFAVALGVMAAIFIFSMVTKLF
jgi:hypothetical protein